jgi:hypothetical protein
MVFHLVLLIWCLETEVLRGTFAAKEAAGGWEYYIKGLAVCTLYLAEMVGWHQA